MRRSGTYFIQAGEGGPIKIGRAVDVGKRLGMLQVGNHEQLRLLAIIPSRAVESVMHRRFAAHRRRGEWFDPVPDLLSFIAHASSGIHICERCVVISDDGPAVPDACIEAMADHYAEAAR